MEKLHSADGTEIAFERSGQGPPLVVVVGAFSDHSSSTTLASGLGDAFTVYAYDRRGRGESGDTPPYSVRREVEDVARLIDAAGEPAFVFGRSSGGSLALEAAAAGVPTRALVVHEPPYTNGPTVAFAERLEELVAEGRDADATVAFLELLGTPSSVVEQMRREPAWDEMQKYAPTLSYEVRLCNNGAPPLDRLANVAAPTLATAGENSPAWAREGAQAIAAAVPTGEARVLEGQGHAPADAVLVSLLKGFFLG